MSSPTPPANPALQVRPATRVGDAPPYKVPRAAAPIDLYLDANEGAQPPPWLLDSLAVHYPEALRRYPSAAALETRLAGMYGVDPAQVIVTAGGDDAIDRLCKATLGEGRTLILPVPGFEMIARYGELAGGEVLRVQWPDVGPWPREAVLAAADARTALVALVTPNNPTGRVADLADLMALSSALPHAIILLDHAYVEYGGPDLTAEALRLPNVVVVRTFSKAWGLAGLRVGYALGNAQVIGWLRVCGAPYAVAGPSLALARARLDQADEVKSHCDRVVQERGWLTDLLVACGLSVPANQAANFVFARFEGPAAEARALWLRDALAGLGLAIRAFPGKPGLSDAVRITLPGDPADFDRLRLGVAAALAPEAILLDVDGVIADVRDSYRAAIVHTCAHFGAAVTPADIAAIKAEGDANNDWIVSQRLLARRGIGVELTAVTEVFEAAYQGTAEVPGLWQTERLLVDRETLARWASRRPLALVTGRPRHDLERLLDQFDLRDLFTATVALEDTPRRKPDPEPVARALALMGLSRAWMLGDTPDDIRAARAAGVVPLGVPAPGEDPLAAAGTLTAAGAARVLGSTPELEVLL